MTEQLVSLETSGGDPCHLADACHGCREALREHNTPPYGVSRESRHRCRRAVRGSGNAGSFALDGVGG